MFLIVPLFFTFIFLFVSLPYFLFLGVPQFFSHICVLCGGLSVRNVNF